MEFSVIQTRHHLRVQDLDANFSFQVILDITQTFVFRTSCEREKNQSKSVRRINSFPNEFVFNNALDEVKILFAQNRVKTIQFPDHIAYFSYQLDLALFKNRKNQKICIKKHREVI